MQVLDPGQYVAAVFEEDDLRNDNDRVAKASFTIVKDPTPPVKADFQLVSLCQVDKDTIKIGVVNKWSGSADYTIRKYQTGPSVKGVAEPSKNPYNNAQDVPFNGPSDTWILNITGTDFTYNKAVGTQEPCQD